MLYVYKEFLTKLSIIITNHRALYQIHFNSTIRYLMQSILILKLSTCAVQFTITQIEIVCNFNSSSGIALYFYLKNLFIKFYIYFYAYCLSTFQLHILHYVPNDYSYHNNNILCVNSYILGKLILY